MKTLRLLLISALLLTALATPNTEAANSLEIPVRLTGGVSSSFFPDPIHGAQNDRLELSTPSFTADLNSLGSLSLNLCAPDGKQIHVDLPEGKTGTFSIAINYIGTLGVFNMTIPSAFADEFVGLSGSAPVLTYSDVDYRQNGNQVAAYLTYTFSAPFSFTAWTGEITGGFATSSGTLTYSNNYSYAQFSYPTTAAGAQFVTFQAPVPEPSSGAMLIFATGLGALFRRPRK